MPVNHGLTHIFQGFQFQVKNSPIKTFQQTSLPSHPTTHTSPHQRVLFNKSTKPKSNPYQHDAVYTFRRRKFTWNSPTRGHPMAKFGAYSSFHFGTSTRIRHRLLLVFPIIISSNRVTIIMIILMIILRRKDQGLMVPARFLLLPDLCSRLDVVLSSIPLASSIFLVTTLSSASIFMKFDL